MLIEKRDEVSEEVKGEGSENIAELLTRSEKVFGDLARSEETEETLGFLIDYLVTQHKINRWLEKRSHESQVRSHYEEISGCYYRALAARDEQGLVRSLLKFAEDNWVMAITSNSARENGELAVWSKVLRALNERFQYR